MATRRNGEKDRPKARRRALRAAQVVTLGLALAGGGGCYAKHGALMTEPAAADDDGGLVDSGDAAPDAMVHVDSGPTDTPDANRADAGGDAAEDGALADAGLCDIGSEPEEYAACCEAHGWDWDWGCMAWGPYVPPGDGPLAAPRATRGIA